MVELTLSVPEPLVARLRDQSRREGRSLNETAIGGAGWPVRDLLRFGTADRRQAAAARAVLGDDNVSLLPAL